MISCKEMKFDEITVTFRFKRPKIPVVEITDKRQINSGKVTHLSFLKITHKIIVRRTMI